MIQITIATPDSITANRVALFLVEQSLVVNAKIADRIKEYSKSGNSSTVNEKFLITAVTKGLLFTTIEKKINENFEGLTIEYYALPIVNMDWQQAEKLIANIEKV